MTNRTAPVVLLDGSAELDRELLGGKAWGINQLAALGLPTPPAFALTTDMCREFHASSGRLPDEARECLADGIAWLEQTTNRTLGGIPPLVVSVRSGAAHSMPGMMDTVLNLGVTAKIERVLAEEFGDSRFASDVRGRFVTQFERVVGHAPPEDPMQQLLDAATAVFGSWNSPRAVAYRNHHNLSHDGGTAVTVQSMVFGNRDESSGTGVLFTRNPLNGAASVYGEWLMSAQGEDVVSGRMTPSGLPTLAQALPDVYRDLLNAASQLEMAGRDVQDIEFTIEAGKLWILQTRAAKRSSEAAVRIAVTLCETGLIDTNEALERIRPDDIAVMLRPRLDPVALRTTPQLANGEPASPGSGTGIVVTTADEAEVAAARGVDVVLARPTTDPDDVHGMIAATAIVTELGGSTSHAAVVSRELGKPCVVGCGQGTLKRISGRTVTVDGASGRIFEGAGPVLQPAMNDPALRLVARWLGRDEIADIQAALRERENHARSPV